MLDTGDTGFMLVATALVMIMTPGLAFFYGGLVSRKNVLTIMMQSYVSMGVTTRQSSGSRWDIPCASAAILGESSGTWTMPF